MLVLMCCFLSLTEEEWCVAPQHPGFSADQLHTRWPKFVSPQIRFCVAFSPHWRSACIQIWNWDMAHTNLHTCFTCVVCERCLMVTQLNKVKEIYALLSFFKKRKKKKKDNLASAATWGRNPVSWGSLKEGKWVRRCGDLIMADGCPPSPHTHVNDNMRESCCHQ